MNTKIDRRASLLFFLPAWIVFLGVFAPTAFGQVTEGRWDEVVGKRVVNSQGVTLGRITDTAIDIEHARYVGMIVRFGDFFGMGGKVKLVPPGAFVENGSGRLLLDMDKETFWNAPSCHLSGNEGPPNADLMADVYRFYGQTPYFQHGRVSGRNASTAIPEKLGFVVKGSKLLLMPVDDLEGERLGIVIGLRALNHRTGKFSGVVISPSVLESNAGTRVLTPRSLRYDLNRDRLRLNDEAESFAHSPTYTGRAGDTSTADGDVYFQENARRPEVLFPVPLEQGNSGRDRRITNDIKRRISRSESLSHYAQNIEVGTVGGQVTLKSRVEDASDRAQLMAHAVQVAGRGNVRDRLNVHEGTSRVRDAE